VQFVPEPEAEVFPWCDQDNLVSDALPHKTNLLGNDVMIFKKFGEKFGENIEEFCSNYC
jgi:hypothetical protein